METIWDCIVVGAGAAGLSAALVLGRARQRTLLADADAQNNRVVEGIGGLLGHDGRPPAAFYAAGRGGLQRYPTVEVRSGEVVAGGRHDKGFVLDLSDGSSEATRRVLLAVVVGSFTGRSRPRSWITTSRAPSCTTCCR